eukprot:COSAG02_NODE_1957_length_10261_cov_51.399134_6_plen_87_part_00
MVPYGTQSIQETQTPEFHCSAQIVSGAPREIELGERHLRTIGRLPKRVCLGRSIHSGQYIQNSGTLIQILARFFSPDTVKTGHCHL